MYRRFDWTVQKIQGITTIISFMIEIMVVILFTFFIMGLISSRGQYFYRIVASLLVLISVAVSYYMTFFKVVVGYGIIASVMTIDIGLAKEVVGLYFVL